MATDNSSVSFRKVKRHSNFRANIFLVETILVLLVYLYILYYYQYQQQQRQDYKVDDDVVIRASVLPILRRHLLGMFGIIYILRLNFMARYLLKRELAIEELTFVILIWIPLIFASFSLKIKNDDGDGVLYTVLQLFASILIYAIGSFLNTYSEVQRNQWKKHLKNKDRCYTEGLFSLCRNINYFGDTMLFAGWALGTGCVLWNSWVPIIMGLSFYFHHIPDKEKYLQQRYGKDWSVYKCQTPWSFIPYIC